MTKEELDYIKDSFSQIIDDIAGNPNWGDAAKAVASDLGTLERELEIKVISYPPSNLDEAAELFNREDAARMWDYEGATEGEIVEAAFKAGADLGAKKMLAKLKENCVIIDKDLYEAAMEGRFIEGREEALKDLPRWRISRAMRSTLPTIMYGDNGIILYKDGFEIFISELDKLPKED